MSSGVGYIRYLLDKRSSRVIRNWFPVDGSVANCPCSFTFATGLLGHTNAASSAAFGR